ncbi:MAG TPA: hypothetical protein VJK05_00655 [archaeon]|nr:hypothetical protein [archaeon]
MEREAVSSEIKTIYDSVYEFVVQNKSVKLTELRKEFDLDAKTLDRVLSVLEDGSLIHINYPAIGEPIAKEFTEPRLLEEVLEEQKKEKKGFFGFFKGRKEPAGETKESMEREEAKENEEERIAPIKPSIQKHSVAEAQLKEAEKKPVQVKAKPKMNLVAQREKLKAELEELRKRK